MREGCKVEHKNTYKPFRTLKKVETFTCDPVTPP